MQMNCVCVCVRVRSQGIVCGSFFHRSKFIAIEEYYSIDTGSLDLTTPF